MNFKKTQSKTKTFVTQADNRVYFRVNNVPEDLYAYLKMRQFRNKTSNGDILKYWALSMPMEKEVPLWCDYFIGELARVTKIEKYEIVLEAIIGYCQSYAKQLYALEMKRQGKKVGKIPDTEEAYMKILGEYFKSIRDTSGELIAEPNTDKDKNLDDLDKGKTAGKLKAEISRRETVQKIKVGKISDNNLSVKPQPSVDNITNANLKSDADETESWE